MKRTITVLATAFMLGACGGPQATTLAPEANRRTVNQIPDWYLSQPTEEDHLLAPATAVSRDLQTAITKAQHEGRLQIANQLEVKYSGLIKRYVEEVGTDEDAELLDQFTQTYKAVVNQLLTGSSARSQEILTEQGMYRAYVLMEMPIGAANKLLVDKVKANQAMYTRFRASEAFQELDLEADDASSASAGQ